MQKIYLPILIFFLFISGVFAQPPATWTSADMYLALRKLNVLGSVLYVAAHPDDENTRLLAYLSKDRMVRTGYLSMTRGDGGQNLIGEEQGIELGLIRTQELLSARRIDGAEQFFTRAYDFGFSKNPEETFTKWDKEKILSDVVWVIRKFQPDVIITRFPTTGEGGHGHHTASAILANEAFTAAADRNRFPEQLKYVQPWQAKRIMWNGFNFGGAGGNRDGQLSVDVGGYNPLLGKSYGEIAAQSRSQHKSQGFGASASRGESYEYFRATNGTQPAKGLLEDVDITWKRVKGSETVSKIIDSLINSFDLLHPEKSVRGLVRLNQVLKMLPDSYWKTQKLQEVLQLIEACSGLWLDATAAQQFAVQTDSIRINFSFNNRLGADAVLQKIEVADFDSAYSTPLQKNSNLNFFKSIYVSPEKNITQPYWLQKKMEEGYFNVSDQLHIGQADADPAYTVAIQLKIYDDSFTFLRPVKYKFTDPVKGELYQPLVVLPVLLVSPDENVKITSGTNNFNGMLRVTSKKKNTTAIIEDAGLQQQDNIKIAYTPDTLLFAQANSTYDVNYMVTAARDNEYNFSVKPVQLQNSYNSEVHEIKYDHIPYINYFTEAAVKNRRLDLKIAGKKIGYIPGAGDKVPEALEQMGYDVTLLTDKELLRSKLKDFDAIITGVRAYNTNAWLNNYYDKLMKYVDDGGNLIVQYNTSTNIGPVRARIAPYNFNISRTRVTDENAIVTFTKPDHPALNYPNKITIEDFKGWIQERSIYHASEWDKNFETIISMNDPGEAADAGSLIIAPYGKGNFVYTGLVFFRELPAGVPGAYRLMANLIALNKRKAF